MTQNPVDDSLVVFVGKLIENSNYSHSMVESMINSIIFTWFFLNTLINLSIDFRLTRHQLGDWRLRCNDQSVQRWQEDPRVYVPSAAEGLGPGSLMDLLCRIPRRTLQNLQRIVLYKELGWGVDLHHELRVRLWVGLLCPREGARREDPWRTHFPYQRPQLVWSLECIKERHLEHLNQFIRIRRFLCSWQ